MSIASKRQLEALTFTISKRKKEIPYFEADLINELFLKFPDFLISLPSEDGDLGKNSVKIEKKNTDSGPISSINVKNDLLIGKISSTKYGEIIKLNDAKDKENNEPSYESKPTEGVEKVFFFLMSLHENKKKGIILLERNGIYGIKSVFITLLKKFFKDYYPEYIFKSSTFIDREIVKRIVEDGVAKSITLTSPRISSDISDQLSITDDTSEYEFQLIIKKKKGFFGSNTRKVVRNLFDDKNKSYVISESMIGLGFDDRSKVSVNFEYNSKNKRINLDESLRAPRSIYDIFVNTDKYGESDFDSISKEAIDKFNLINPM